MTKRERQRNQKVRQKHGIKGDPQIIEPTSPREHFVETLREKLKAIDFMSYISPGCSVQVDKRLFTSFDELAMWAQAGAEIAEYMLMNGLAVGEQEVHLEKPAKGTYYAIICDGNVFLSKEPVTMEPLAAD